MRKLFALLLVLSVAVFTVNTVQAQDGDQTATEQVEEAAGDAAEAVEETAADAAEAVEEMADDAAAAVEDATTISEGEGTTMFQVLKKNFISGYWKFMSFDPEPRYYEHG